MLRAARRRLLLAAALTLLVLVAAPASAHAAGWIVIVEDGADAADVASDALVAEDRRFELVINGFTARLSAAQRTALLADPRVAEVYRDRVARRAQTQRAPKPQITSFGQDRIGLLESRTANVDGRNDRLDVDVAVFDSGIDASLRELRVRGGVDCAGVGRWTDDDGHGTLVSGLIAAKDNRRGTVGVAPGARLWSVRVEDENAVIYESALLCGLEWVATRRGKRAIEVINMSFGITDRVRGVCGVKVNRRGRTVVRDALHAAICDAYLDGTTIVASAGNESMNVRRSLPAAYPEVIAVSAITETDGLGAGGPDADCLPGERDDHLATFSNYGRGIDFAAPGVCLSSTFLGGQYARVSGTSFSAPFVTGAAALAYERWPNVTPHKVLRRLTKRAANDPIPGDPDRFTEPVIDVSKL